MKEYENYPLLPHNTFGIDARARRFLEFPDSGEPQAHLHGGERYCFPL